MNLIDWIGYTVSQQSWKYTWKEAALYALAVGAKEYELKYLYAHRDDFEVLPTFALIPCFISNYIEPKTWFCKCPGQMLQKSYHANGMNWDQELEIFRPLDARNGILMWDYAIENIYDRGPGKGVVIQNVLNIHDEVGRLLGRCKNGIVMFAEGGFGGEAPPETKADYPDREPDYAAEEWIDFTMTMLYNLASNSVSSFPIHIDSEYCKRELGTEGVLVPGNLTLGVACRCAVSLAMNGAAGKLTYIYAQFRAPLYSGRGIKFLGWETEPGNLLFRVVETETNKMILNNGIIRWRT